MIPFGPVPYTPVSQGFAPKTDCAVGAELPDPDVPDAGVVDEDGVEELDEPLVVEAGVGELATAFPLVGIATPIFLASSAAVRVKRSRKSPAPAVGFGAVLVAAAGDPAPASELTEVR